MGNFNFDLQSSVKNVSKIEKTSLTKLPFNFSAIIILREL